MNWTRLWPDRIGTRISIILVLALIVEFVGSEFVYRYSEESAAARANVERLADQLGVADRLLSELPAGDRAAAARRLWSGPFSVSWVRQTGLAGAAPTPETEKLREALTGEDAPFEGRRIQFAVLPGDVLSGALSLRDGSWIEFRGKGYLERPSPVLNHIGLTLLIVSAVTLVALVLMRMLHRPLRETIKVIEGLDLEKPVLIDSRGTRELQHVARAINAMQQRLLDLVNDRVQALAAVSHDLRTPIARLRLRAASVGDPDLRAAIGHDLDEMEAFMTTVLDYLRDDGSEPPCLADVASLLQTIVDDARDLGGDAVYEGPPRLEAVTRPVKLGRVVTNLVQNALHHAGQARVSLAQAEDGIRIAVEDDGPGIPPHQIDEVFRPFHRLESSRNRNTGGAGLGLSIVKRSVERLGGTISLENRAEGGLRAEVVLPSSSL